MKKLYFILFVLYWYDLGPALAEEGMIIMEGI